MGTLMRAAAFVFVCFCFLTGGTGRTLAQTQPGGVARYSGEGQIGSEPPFPIHIEVTRSNGAVEGVISSPGAAFKLVEARGSDVVQGRISGDGGNGTIRLRFDGERIDGTFELEGQPGKLWAKRTDLDAARFFKGPDQKLDLTTQQWRQDLDRLVQILTTHHGSPFHRISQTKFHREVAQLRAQLPRLAGPEIAVQFVRLAAQIGDGHTWVAFPRGRPRFNFETFWFEDGLRVVGIEAAHKELLGARLIAVEDQPIDEVMGRLRQFAAQGETEWGYRSVAPYLVGSLDVLNAADIGSGATRHFTFQIDDGRRLRLPLQALVERPARMVLGGGPPLWDRGTESFRSEPLVDGTTYVNWRSYDNLAQNSSALFAELDRQRPRRLIIDLRDNGGGDYNHGRRFIAQLKARDWLNHPDRLFLLIGRQTFSAAMTNAADFKKDTRATIIGEPPGAAPNNWQELRRFHLPHSGLAVGVSTKYYEFLPGESAVRPSVHIPPEPADWGAPYDAAVRYILALPCRRL